MNKQGRINWIAAVLCAVIGINNPETIGIAAIGFAINVCLGLLLLGVQ